MWLLNFSELLVFNFSKLSFSQISMFCPYICVTLSWRRSLSYRNQTIDLLNKSMGWFLYDRNLLMKELTHFPSMLRFCLPWKQRFSDVFRGYKNETLMWNVLTLLWVLKCCESIYDDKIENIQTALEITWTGTFGKVSKTFSLSLSSLRLCEECTISPYSDWMRRFTLQIRYWFKNLN